MIHECSTYRNFIAYTPPDVRPLGRRGIIDEAKWDAEYFPPPRRLIESMLHGAHFKKKDHVLYQLVVSPDV